MVNSLSFGGVSPQVVKFSGAQQAQKVKFGSTEATNPTPPAAQPDNTAKPAEANGRSFKTKVLDGLKKSALSQGIGVALDVAAIALAPLTASFSLALLIPGLILNGIGVYKFIKGYKNGTEAAPQNPPPAQEPAKSETVA